MSAAIGIATDLDLAAPSGGHAHMQSKATKVDVVEEMNAVGVTVFADAKIATRADVKMEGVGTPDFSLVASGAIAVDTLSIVSAKLTESNDKRPHFEYAGVLYGNRQSA